MSVARCSTLGEKRAIFPCKTHPETLTSHQKEILDIVVNTQPELYRAYLLKENLRLILKLTDVEAADAALKKWYYRASHSRLPEVKELATKIKRHKENILNTIKNKFSSARLESMNAKIKLMIRRAYGFRNVDNLIAYVLLFCSAIEIPLPNRPGPISINDLIWRNGSSPTTMHEEPFFSSNHPDDQAKLQ